MKAPTSTARRQTRSSRFAPRPRLIQRLTEALAENRVAVVVAPAGFGKSVLLGQYAASLAGRSAFLDAAALTATSKLDARFVGGTVLVDSIDRLTNEAVAALVSAVTHADAQTRWIIATRASRRLPIATWIAYGDCGMPIRSDELAFTVEELANVARSDAPHVSNGSLQEILNHSRGWPAVVRFGLQSFAGPADTGGALSAMRDLTDQFVGDEIYNAIPEEDRPVIDLAALLPDFDAALLERAGFDAALATFESVSRQTAILRERVPGVYDCHPVFQEFLVSRTRRSGAIAARALHVQAARALESAFCLGPALEAYTLAGSTLDVLRIIETHGFELVDRGLIDPLVKGIALLDPAAKRSNPRIVALRGVIYSFAGKRPRAESLLKRALDLAKSDEELFAKISITLAMILTNKGEGIATLLEPVLENRALSYACRAEALSLLAAQRSLVGDAESARKAIAEIDSILSNVDIDIPRAKVLQRLGVAYIYIGEATQAKETLLEAADIALGLQLMSLASRAYTNLSNLMLYEFDDVRMQLAYARKGLEAANAARNPFDIQTALLQIIAAETRSGNGEASEHAEAELARHLEGDESRLHYLATSKALRAAWKGDFGSAHRLISPCWWRLHNKLDQLTIGAHCALFLAVDAKREASVVLITKLLMLASPVRDDSRCIARAKAVCLMFCAIAETLNGRNGRSQRIIAELKSDADEVIKIASSVADEIIPMLQPKYSGFRKPTVSARLEELSTLGYGFVPRTLGALLEHIASDSSRIEGNPLTASELSTLRMLDRGLATKEIALRKKCSIYTVRAHIANAIGKLHCRGRAEALATARGLGFLD